MTLDSGNVRFVRIFAVVLEIYVNFPYTYAYVSVSWVADIVNDVIQPASVNHD